MGVTGTVLVTGAGGLLGRQVVAALEASGAATAAYAHAALDIGDRNAVLDVVRTVRPNAIVNAAALTAVDRCESEPDECMSANGAGPGHVAEAAGAVGAEMVHVSTDYVFDGEKGEPYVEEDPAAPLQTYGRCKLEGERAVRAATEACYIVRTAMVFGRGGRNFLSRLPDVVETGEAVSAVSDQVGSPTYAPDLAAAIVGMIGSRTFGTYHVANAGGCTMVEFCSLALELMGRDPPLREVLRAELDRPAARPRDTRLDGPAWKAAGFGPLRPWTDAARDFFAV